MTKITVVGTGYVGLSLSVLLAQHNEVIALDIDKEKVDKINDKKSPISDTEIEDFPANKSLNLTATTDRVFAYSDCEFVVVATPTDYDTENNFFNTKSVEAVIKDALEFNLKATIIIKSTVPVGFTQKMNDEFGVKTSSSPLNFLEKVKPSGIILTRHEL